MALHISPPVAIADRHSHRRQTALSDSYIFEHQLFSFLESPLVGSDKLANSVSQTTGIQIAPGRWHSILTEIYRPLGIELRSVQQASELLCRCVINAERLSGVIALAEQFPTDGLLPKLHYESREDSISLYSDADSHQCSIPILQLAGYLKLFSWLIGAQIPVLQVQLPTPERALTADFVRWIFNCNVSSGQQRSALAFEDSWLQRPVIRTYVDLRSILSLPSLALIPWPTPVSTKVRVTQLITKAISRHGQAPSLDEVALLLSRSSSTLRRQLQQEGTSFQTLKDAWRLQRAKELLQSEKPLADIANILGFESNTVFSRAFKSWTGVAPSMFRATLDSS